MYNIAQILRNKDELKYLLTSLVIDIIGFLIVVGAALSESKGFKLLPECINLRSP